MNATMEMLIEKAANAMAVEYTSKRGMCKNGKEELYKGMVLGFRSIFGNDSKRVESRFLTLLDEMEKSSNSNSKL